MPFTDNPGDKYWFVLNFIEHGVTTPQRHIDLFNKDGERLELFAPTFRYANVVDGRVVFRERLLTAHYVFVRGTLDDVKQLCASPVNGLSMLLDRGSTRRYGIVSNAAMHSFRILARLHSNTIPFYRLDDIELEEGDLVEVVGGPYAGLTGTFMPRSRSTKGNLVIAVTAALGAIVWDIEARYVRILRFAANTRRQYDILESFVPRLFGVLRKHHSGDKFTDKDKSVLDLFNQRMGSVSLDNQKLEAKLAATLMCVRLLLGDMDGYADSCRRFARYRNSITNVWTQAFVELLSAVSRNDMTHLRDTYRSISRSTDKLSGSQRQLLDEYQYYLG